MANVLLSLSLKGVDGRAAAAHAAQEVARAAARKLLLPLLDHVILRLSAVLRRTWHICVEHCAAQGERQIVAYSHRFSCLNASLRSIIPLLIYALHATAS